MLSFYLCTLVALFDIVLSYAHYSDSGFTGHLLQKRKKSGDDNSATPVLIGDLRYRIQSQEAQDIANILLDDRGGVKSETNEYDTKPVDDVLECSAADPCCQYYFISEELTDAFLEADKQCNDMARAAIRLGFHDAGTWSQSLADAGQDFGGADGSLALFFEDDKPENGGLFEVTELARDIYYRYDVGMADLIQYMATHATVSCPLGPRIRTYVGREDAVQPAPDGLLPSVHAPADDLIALFEDKTITPHMLTALLGAHSTSKQFGVDHAKHGAPQDSTPGVWDVEYYNQTLDSYESECVFKFESDVKLAKHPRMKDEWQGFIDDQDHWNEDFAAAYLRLSLLGVNNINELKECSKTLPPKKNRSPK
ncbi:heme peroxidase, partial [Lophiotrema nucula]